MPITAKGLACSLAVLLALALAACGDDDSVSQEELQQATEEAAEEARQEAENDAQLSELRDKVEELQEEQAGGDSGSENGSDDATTTAIVPDTGGVPADAEPCGAGVFARSGTTSCGFALNVADGYYTSGSNTFDVFSPATGETYTMTCSGGAPVICTGGNNAAVYLP